MNSGYMRVCLEFRGGWYNAGMTLVEITYELRSPLTAEQLRRLGIELPRSLVEILLAVMTHAGGVSHPTFLLRGRWNRSLKNDMQPPPPPLVSIHITSFEAAQQKPEKHGFRQYKDRPRIK